MCLQTMCSCLEHNQRVSSQETWKILRRLQCCLCCAVLRASVLLLAVRGSAHVKQLYLRINLISFLVTTVTEK